MDKRIVHGVLWLACDSETSQRSLLATVCWLPSRWVILANIDPF